MRDSITRTILFKVLATTIIWSVLVAPATSANVKDAQTCDKVTDFDRSIPACTRYLASKTISTRLRAMALGDRCAAWLKKSDHESFERINEGLERREEDLRRALADCNEALKLGPDLAVVYLNRGALWSYKFDFDRALADYNQLILLAPKAPVGYFNRGQVWLEQHDYDRAIGDANEVIRIAPNPEAGYELRGQAWFEKGDYDRAITDFDKAIRLNPRVSMAYNDRALVWIAKGESDRALADENEAIHLDPNNSKAFSARGEAWRLKGDLDRAISDQNQAIKLTPGGPVQLIRRGDTRRYRGEFQLALADYEQALRLIADYIPAFTGRGLTFEKMGDRERAAAEFKRALASPSHLLRDVSRSAIETAHAHLAALEAGAPLPVIPAAPLKAASESSIPTPAVVLPDLAHPPTHQRRIALVIGNSAYLNVPALVNPQHDADKVAATLRAIGFDSVMLVNNATHQTLIDALRTFAHSSEQADWAMIYYAGHGIEVNGVNFIIPIDAKLAVDRDVEFEAVPLDQIMTALEGARKLKLVLLDACRDNPFVPQMRHTAAPQTADSRSTAGGVLGTRSIGRGLSEIKVAGATLVVYAAKSGQVALDGEGDDSPFAVAVIQRIAVPSVEINKVFRLVRDDVMEATAGRQEPYTYGSLPGSEDFYFVEK